jgi:hypothetical protein
MLPPHLTGAHLLGLAERHVPVTGLRSGTAGGLDVFDFEDGGSIVVMPADPATAARVTAALEQGREVRLLGTSEVGAGRSLTFLVAADTAYVLADRVYARPPQGTDSRGNRPQPASTGDTEAEKDDAEDRDSGADGKDAGPGNPG